MTQRLSPYRRKVLRRRQLQRFSRLPGAEGAIGDCWPSEIGATLLADAADSAATACEACVYSACARARARGRRRASATPCAMARPPVRGLLEHTKITELPAVPGTPGRRALHQPTAARLPRVFARQGAKTCPRAAACSARAMFACAKCPPGRFATVDASTQACV
jgi:hypothetical protein